MLKGRMGCKCWRSKTQQAQPKPKTLPRQPSGVAPPSKSWSFLRRTLHPVSLRRAPRAPALDLQLRHVSAAQAMDPLCLIPARSAANLQHFQGRVASPASLSKDSRFEPNEVQGLSSTLSAGGEGSRHSQCRIGPSAPSLAGNNFGEVEPPLPRLWHQGWAPGALR